MKKTTSNPGTSIRKFLVVILAVFCLVSVQSTYAHSVDSYAGTCLSGPQYKVTAVVSNVNSTSNYRWQWKNGSSWVCFVNGANTINGNSYNVSGSVYNLTTNPGPIIFTNPGSGLQGLEIRMVISDGNGVNPCTLPVGNTWTSTTNHFINVANTACAPCTAKVTSLYFNKLDNGADIPITNGTTFSLAQLSSLYNLEVSTTGTVGSVKYTITGPTPTTNIENTTPYNSPATGNGAWTGAVGTYTVNLKTYSDANASGNLCHDTTITFILASCPTSVTVVSPQANVTCTNTFEYNVCQPCGQAVSHWTIGLPTCFTASRVSAVYFNNVVTSNWSIGTDPTCNFFGLKVDNISIPGGSCATIKIVFNSNYTVGTNNWSSKVATNCTQGGPVAAPLSCSTCPQTGSIGDRVWYDTDRDGIQDGGENGILGVTVKLRNASNTVIATTTTNANGNYLFSGLNAGTYSVEFPVTVFGYILSPAYVGANRDVDSDPSVSTGVTPSITLSIGQNITNIDAGFAPDCSCVNSTANLLTNASFENGTTGWSWSAGNGSLSTGNGYVACGAANGFNNWSSGTSKVWQDVTVSVGATVTFSAYAGTHTGGISCSPKLSLIFLNSTNAVIGQTDVIVTRDVDINSNQLQLYSVTAVAPAGTVKARVQSSITCNTMKLDAFCLTATVPPNLNLGNFVWHDANNNGAQDATEPGISGATVKLYVDANSDNVPDGAAVATTTTNATGAYGFGSLTAHNYIVGVTLPAGYTGAATTATSAAPNNDNNTDNNGVTIVSGELRSNFITLTAGGEPTTDGDDNNGNLTLDFGLKGTASIGDYVWEDLNRNGLQDATEPAITGATVTLTTPTGTLTTTTNASGAYNFANLIPGTYTVTFTTPANYVSTLPNVGANDAIDSDPVNGVVSNIVLTAGQVNNTVDAGFYRLININGNVWHDANGLTDLQINKTSNQSIPNTLYIYLVDANTNQIVQLESPLENGTFRFIDVEINRSYVIVLSTVLAFPGQSSPIPFLPSGWQRVGENLGAGPLSGSDGFPDGMLFLDTETSDVFDANFGIRLLSGEVIIG